MRPRADARDTVPKWSARERTRQKASINKVHGGCCRARTVCLMARRRLGKGSADVLPIRQRNCSKIDYCNCPRYQPLL
ncbi:hypothetical protein BLA3211_01376 [Burkholderia aenigmatica]|uniref:Uncharacterized protein n=1 Tax=Burkholderia aenigmatica TaxID=2015348 RepID=A0A6J5IUR5_9BURK|nr:hypothetical protein BLA3211_01376 [Burkholderia aenigmatica]VWC66127.1 hypothetical protein BLA17378_02868 [Burkholderia aenigmatica]